MFPLYFLIKISEQSIRRSKAVATIRMGSCLIGQLDFLHRKSGERYDLFYRPIYRKGTFGPGVENGGMSVFSGSGYRLPTRRLLPVWRPGQLGHPMPESDGDYPKHLSGHQKPPPGKRCNNERRPARIRFDLPKGSESGVLTEDSAERGQMLLHSYPNCDS